MADIYYKSKIKCNICGDEFELENRSERECKCKSNKVDGHGAYYTHKTYGKNFTILEQKSYVISDSFYRLTDKEEKFVYDLEKKLKSLERHSYVHISTDVHGENDEKYLDWFKFEIDDIPIGGKYATCTFNTSCDIRNCGTIDQINSVRRSLVALNRVINYSKRKFDGDIKKTIAHIWKKNRYAFDFYTDERVLLDLVIGCGR
ncbi:MAG: hypothetical protein ACRDBY_00725 [Cetobacterium sp.]